MPPTDVFIALLAGWASGFAVGLASTAWVMIALARSRDWAAHLPSALRVSLPIYGIVIVNVLVFGWTLVGFIAGALYHAGGRGPFSFGVLGVTGLLASVYGGVRGRPLSGEAMVVWATLATALAAFLGLLPFLVSL